MGSRKMQKAASVTREAHQALLDLKKLVDTATQKTHAAELETVGQAVSSLQREDALTTMRTFAEAIGSPDFEAAVPEARLKIETAVASDLAPEDCA
jgi:hypothetical protein